MTPKPGQSGQLQAALANHGAWRAEHGGTWVWTVFEVVQGDNIGDWYITSFRHAWDDLDSYQSPEGAAEHWAATVTPHLGALRSNILVTDDALTRAPEEAGYTLFQVTTWNLRPATLGTFDQSVARMMEAYDRAEVRYFRFYWNMVIGPDDHQKVRSRFYRSWAEMADAPNTPAIMTEVYGEEETAEIFDDFREALISTRDYVLRVHPEMSVPGASQGPRKPAGGPIPTAPIIAGGRVGLEDLGDLDHFDGGASVTGARYRVRRRTTPGPPMPRPQSATIRPSPAWIEGGWSAGREDASGPSADVEEGSETIDPSLAPSTDAAIAPPAPPPRWHPDVSVRAVSAETGVPSSSSGSDAPGGQPRRAGQLPAARPRSPA